MPDPITLSLVAILVGLANNVRQLTSWAYAKLTGKRKEPHE